jgi:hypothetical protein
VDKSFYHVVYSKRISIYLVSFECKIYNSQNDVKSKHFWHHTTIDVKILWKQFTYSFTTLGKPTILEVNKAKTLLGKICSVKK